MLLPNRNLEPAYRKFDLSARYSVRSSLQLHASIENLFSQHYEAAFGFPAAPFTIRGGLKFTLGGPVGRAFWKEPSGNPAGNATSKKTQVASRAVQEEKMKSELRFTRVIHL